MSRARNIKPGFFKNDRLAECEPLARLLFVGLWCEADREGRLEDRPRRLKAEILPYDECDFDALLGQLQAHGFILRYSVAGERYIAIPAFAKHQNPHVKEGASQLPAPDSPGASPVQVPGETGTSHADSPSLIPDSPSRLTSFAAPEVPAWLSKTSWKDWCAFRKSKKGWTVKAQELSLRTLGKLRGSGHDPTLVIEQSIERGWTGLFGLKDNGNAERSGHRESLVDRAARKGREADERDRARGFDPD